MTKKEILEIYKEFRVPKHIIAHMRVVAHIAQQLASRLQKKQIKIDKDAVIQAALLHDVVRYVDFKLPLKERFKDRIDEKDLEFYKNTWKKYHKLGHEKAMAKILREKGEEKIAKIIAKHGFFSVWKLKNWDEKILYYADKRVDHDSIVDLKKRFSEGKKRNMLPTDDQKLVEQTEKEAEKLELEIEKILGESINKI